MTTITTLIISNLNDTVTKNDVGVRNCVLHFSRFLDDFFLSACIVFTLAVMCSAFQELCSAVGPVENVQMPVLGEAEVTFRYKDDALEAYRKYNQRNLDGMRHLVYKQKFFARCSHFSTAQNFRLLFLRMSTSRAWLSSRTVLTCKELNKSDFASKVLTLQMTVI